MSIDNEGPMGDRDMGRSRKTRQKRYRLMAVVVVAAGSACGCHDSKHDDANRKRWDAWMKANQPNSPVIQGAFEARQRQLAAKRAKVGAATSEKPNEPGKDAASSKKPAEKSGAPKTSNAKAGSESQPATEGK